MINLALKPNSLASAVHAETEQGSARRLNILFPPGIDYSIATPRILEIAKAAGIDVLLLGLCREVTEEQTLRRELVTLSALLGNTGYVADVKIETGKNWLQFVQCNYRVGDIIVCLETSQIAGMARPLSQILELNLNSPIYYLSGHYPQNQPISHLYSHILSWAGSIGILAGFFLLQVQIVSITKDWAQTVLLIVSTIVEVWLIGVWNSLV